MRRQTTDWEKIFIKDTSGKGLLPQINNKILILNNKKINYLIKKQSKDLKTPHQRRYTDGK